MEQPEMMDQPVQTETWKAQSLEELIRILHRIFAEDKVSVEEVQALMESYESNPEEWLQYAKFDQYRYTRNLVDNGNGKFNLMILCWGEGHGSSIHDHTDSHCFMKILQGNLKETLFEWPEKKGNGEMIKKSERVLRENHCAYINDSIGLHRVENISHTETAVSLHLYSPPFDSCNTFDQRTGHKHKVKMTFYSQFGERTLCVWSHNYKNHINRTEEYHFRKMSIQPLEALHLIEVEEYLNDIAKLQRNPRKVFVFHMADS